MVGALIIFGKGGYILSLVGYGSVTKTFRVGCTFKVVADKTKCQKMNVIPLRTKSGWVISPSFFGAKSLEATIFYSDFQHNILAL